LSDHKNPTQQPEIDATKATAGLPGLDIDIVHHPPGGDAEHISINLQAAPSFEAFGRFIESANPFAYGRTRWRWHGSHGAPPPGPCCRPV
jgi:hypothetical protein